MLLGFDLQGWITLIAGLLLALITLFTGYDHVHVFWGPTLQLNQQVGISLLLASLAPLALEAQLASRRRSRDQIDRAEAKDEALESEIAQLKNENARLAQIDSRLARFEREHLSGSTPPPSTDDFSS